MKKYKGFIIFISLILIMILCYVGLFIVCNLYKINTFVSILMQVIGFLLCIPLFVALHELGHMVFGLITGYKVLSYKLGPFEWYNKDEKIAFRINPPNMLVLGQCLMSPPKPTKKKKTKFFLYNAGGLIFSYSFDVVLILLFFVIDNGYIKFLLLPMISISIFLTLNNSIYQKGGINDVCNHVLVKKNPKYINSILYQLEVITNITNGKRYGAKTLYEPYFEDTLNHITLPVALFRFLQAVDKSDFTEAKRINTIIRKNYHRIPMPLQRISVIFDILFTDIVIDNNMKDFKKHFKWITEKEKSLCLKFDYDITYYYEIYSKIYDGNYDIKNIIDKLLNSDILLDGEKSSIEKKLNLLVEKLEFYISNGNSFVPKE